MRLEKLAITPECDGHRYRKGRNGIPAAYSGPTREGGRWYMCLDCLHEFGYPGVSDNALLERPVGDESQETEYLEEPGDDREAQNEPPEDEEPDDPPELRPGERNRRPGPPPFGKYDGPDRDFGQHDDYRVGDEVWTYDNAPGLVVHVRPGLGDETPDYNVEGPDHTGEDYRVRTYDGSRLALVRRKA